MIWNTGAKNIKQLIGTMQWSNVWSKMMKVAVWTKCQSMCIDRFHANVFGENVDEKMKLKHMCLLFAH